MDDVYSSIQPVFQTSRLLGFTPYRVIGLVPYRRLVLCKWWALTSLLFLSVLVFMSVDLGTADILTFTEQSLSVRIVNAQQRVIDEALSVVIVVVGWYKSRKLVRFYAGIDSVDKSLATIGVAVSHTTAFWLSLVSLVASFSLCFVGTSALRYFNGLEGLQGPYTLIGISRYFCENITSIINNMLVVSFVNNILLLRERFALINAQLADDVEVTQKIFVSRYLDDVSLLPKVQTLRRIHDQLCELAEDVNDVFSLQLLLYVGDALTSVTCKFNNAFKSLLIIHSMPPEHFWGTMPFLVSSVYGAMVIVVHTVSLTATCARTHWEANHTPILVNKLLMKKSHSDLKQELMEFSNQLLHRKVQFTAFEFFPLDATLLYSIVGAVTTYLIILLQFQ